VQAMGLSDQQVSGFQYARRSTRACIIILVQGGTKLALNVYRGWVGERAKRDLRRRIRLGLKVCEQLRDKQR
jgi:hypothetical protein